MGNSSFLPRIIGLILPIPGTSIGPPISPQERTLQKAPYVRLHTLTFVAYNPSKTSVLCSLFCSDFQGRRDADDRRRDRSRPGRKVSTRKQQLTWSISFDAHWKRSYMFSPKHFGGGCTCNFLYFLVYTRELKML